MLDTVQALSAAARLRRIDAGALDADAKPLRPLPPGRAAARDGFLVADDRWAGGAAAAPGLLRLDRIPQIHHHKLSSMLRQSAATLGAHSAHLQCSLERRTALRYLRDCKPASEAKYLWSYGADYGEFGGNYHEAYVKDLPLERVPSDVLIAYELNGAPLPTENGFPARLVVPGFYGTNSVKWLTRMTVAETRATGAFTTRWYNDPVPNAAGEDSGETVPVWSVAPESIIVSPAPGQEIKRNTPQEIWGWAWSDRGIDRVDVSGDGGATWREAKVEPRAERAWQKFVFSWRATEPGPVVLCSKAYGHDGARQPEFGWRNAIHRIEVKVV